MEVFYAFLSHERLKVDTVYELNRSLQRVATKVLTLLCSYILSSADGCAPMRHTVRGQQLTMRWRVGLQNGREAMY
jgi:hypothetical protein